MKSGGDDPIIAAVAVEIGRATNRPRSPGDVAGEQFGPGDHRENAIPLSSSAGGSIHESVSRRIISAMALRPWYGLAYV